MFGNNIVKTDWIIGQQFDRLICSLSKTLTAITVADDNLLYYALVFFFYWYL